MIVQNIIAHLIAKKADMGASELSLCPETIASTPVVDTFVEELNKVYNSKPSKVFGRFLDAPSSDELQSNHVLLKGYIEQQINFIDYTQQAMHLLKHFIDQASKATGGYMVFVHYTLFGSDFMLISMLNNTSGVAIDDDFSLTTMRYLDINKLHLAARIDLTLWRDDPDSGRYISMIRGKESNKLSDYFRKFIGSDETIDSKQETSELLSAVSQFCDKQLDDDEARSQFKHKATEFCLEQADKGQNVVLKDFSGYVADNAVDDFMNYINGEQFSLANEISPNRTVIRRFNKISGRNQQVSITINEEALGDTVIYDTDKETLTLSDLPASLKAQLSNH